VTGRRRPGRTGAPGYAATAGGDPFAGVERVYVDGNNLLHALARGGPPGPAGAVVGRIRAAFPPSVIVDLVFDGPPSGGIKGRLATGLRVAYSGRLSADRVIDEGIAAQLAADGPAGTWGILVITDDRGLREAVAAKGARTAGTAWLTGRIGRLAVEVPGRGAERSPAGRAAERSAAGRRGRSGPLVPLPKAGTTFGHRRPPRPPASDAD